MKRGAPSHPKTLAFMTLLGLPRYAAVGVLELLWHFAGQYARRGDIGRHSNTAIAAALGWDGDADQLIKALVLEGWLDECPCHRLRVHDWPDHADQAVNKTAEVKKSGFLECYGLRPSAIRPPETYGGSQSVRAPAPAVTPAPVTAQDSRQTAQGTGQTANGPPSFPLPPDLRTEKALRDARWRDERELLRVVGQIAETTRDPKYQARADLVMERVTAYKRADGSIAPGRRDPALLRSHEAVIKSLEDARAWLADEEKAS